jgi:hypothetical protein
MCAWGPFRKYRLTQGLTLDVTVNPDFAQVEVDQQRVNGVLRIRKNVLRGSDIGVIVMMRDAVGDESSYNRVYGLDSYIRFLGEIDWSSYYVASESPAFDDGQYAWRTSINREGNFHHIKAGAMQLGESSSARAQSRSAPSASEKSIRTLRGTTSSWYGTSNASRRGKGFDRAGALP